MLSIIVQKKPVVDGADQIKSDRMYVDDGSSYMYYVRKFEDSPPVAQNLNKKSIADGFPPSSPNKEELPSAGCYKG